MALLSTGQQRYENAWHVQTFESSLQLIQKLTATKIGLLLVKL